MQTTQPKTAVRTALAIALGLACVSAHSTATYGFSSAPIAVFEERDFSSAITTYPPGMPGMPVPSVFGASLTFPTALSPSTTTLINAESGGGDAVFAPSQGNVSGFVAVADTPFRFSGEAEGITSLLTTPSYYSSSEGPLIKYGEVRGSLTTNAAGDIAEWDLVYSMFRVTGDATRCVGGGSPTPAAPCALSSVDLDPATRLTLSITSGPPTLIGLPYTFLNGMVASGSLPVNQYDVAFGNPGGTSSIRRNAYTKAAGSWSSPRINAVPEPGTLALMLLSGGGLALVMRRRQNRKTA